MIASFTLRSRNLPRPSRGTGAGVMKRIAVPMVGSGVTSMSKELMVYPAIFFLWRSRGVNKSLAVTAPSH